MKPKTLARCSLLTGLFPSVAMAAIFGANDIEPLYPSHPLQRLARATAVAVLSSNIEPDPLGGFRLDAPPASWLCPGERLSGNPSLAYACSGFLIAPDLLVTAGHCGVNTGEVSNELEGYCSVYSWLFDYQEAEGVPARLRGIPAENHYRCKKIIYAVREDPAPYRDYALIQLDRPVEGREPLKMSLVAPKAGDPLFMIGYPAGTPVKLSSRAKVLLNEEKREIFLANLDAVSGFSGSAVFNASSEVVGILVGGYPSRDFLDFQWAGKKCSRMHRCTEEGDSCEAPDLDLAPFPSYLRTGTEIQRILPIVDLAKSHH